MSIKIKDIIYLMEEYAHPKHAESWDNIGLQLGNPGDEVEKVLVTLDLSLDVVAEAIEKQIDLIIVHHTPFFKPLTKILWNTPQGRMIQQLIVHHIGLYCAHTNLDSCPGGVNDLLAELLELENIQVLQPNWQEEYYKLVVFIPLDYVDQVREALGEVGAGWIGRYSHCTFKTLGTGTFKPLVGSQPFSGKLDKLSRVEEYRLETILPKGLINSAIEAMMIAHPYDEVAYDLYPLSLTGELSGLGRIGNLKDDKSLMEIMKLLKARLAVDNLRYVGNPEYRIARVAVCGGSGAFLINQAVARGAQLLITGDLKYHEAQEAEYLGLCLIDAGHFATENPIVEKLVALLLEKTAGKIDIQASKINTNPFEFF